MTPAQVQVINLSLKHWVSQPLWPSLEAVFSGLVSRDVWEMFALWQTAELRPFQVRPVVPGGVSTRRGEAIVTLILTGADAQELQRRLDVFACEGIARGLNTNGILTAFLLRGARDSTGGV